MIPLTFYLHPDPEPEPKQDEELAGKEEVKDENENDDDEEKEKQIKLNKISIVFRLSSLDVQNNRFKSDLMRNLQNLFVLVGLPRQFEWNGVTMESLGSENRTKNLSHLIPHLSLSLSLSLMISRVILLCIYVLASYNM